MDPINQFGDALNKKPDHHTRCLSLNINTFPISDNNRAERLKFELLHDLVKETNPDVIMTQEDNTYWPNVKPYNRPSTRCKSWFEQLKISTTYTTMTNEMIGHHLPGGESVWLTNKIAHRYKSMNHDSRLMGRWSYQSIQRKDGNNIRFYSAYRPRISHGIRSIYSQQIRGLAIQYDMRCPRRAFLEDLTIEIEEAIQKKELVVLAMDANTDITANEIKSFAHQLNLINPITKKHGTNGPPTHARESKQTSLILTSPQIEVVNCGYLPAAVSPSKHRILWIDINNESIFDSDDKQETRTTDRRPKLDDPNQKKKFQNQQKHAIHSDNTGTLDNNQLDIGSRNPTHVCQETANNTFKNNTAASIFQNKLDAWMRTVGTEYSTMTGIIWHLQAWRKDTDCWIITDIITGYLSPEI